MVIYGNEVCPTCGVWVQTVNHQAVAHKPTLAARYHCLGSGMSVRVSQARYGAQLNMVRAGKHEGTKEIYDIYTRERFTW